jgi:hypothetical protein
MQEYAPDLEGGLFAYSRAYYAELEQWLSGAAAAGLQHAELEEQLHARGRCCCAGCTRVTWTCWRRVSGASRM